MTDIPAVPPTPAAPVAQTATPAPPPQPRTIASVPVAQAPPALQNPPAPVRVQGQVISANPQTGQVSVQTPQGTVEVESPVALPQGAQVSLEIFTDNGAALANITVLRQPVAAAPQLPQVEVTGETQTPPPPLQAGDTVTALQLPPVAQDSAPSLPALPLAQAAQVISAAKGAELPVSAGVPQEVFAAPDVLKALQSLPPAAQQKITQFVSSPAFLQSVKSAISPAQWRALDIPLAAEEQPKEAPGLLQRLISAYLPRLGEKADDIAPPAPPDEQIDANLLLIARAQAGVKSSQQAIAAGAKPFAGALPLPEQPGKDAAPLQRQIVADTQQKIDGAAQNISQLKILRVLPPGIQAALAPGAKTGEVESLTPGGNPVIRTADGQRLVLRAPADVPVGSTVVFEEKPLTPDEAVSLLQPKKTDGAERAFDPLIDDTWPALQEAVQSAPPAAAQALQNVMPAPTAHMAPAALLFLAALRGGEIENWLGSGIAALRQAGKGALTDRLAEDFGKISDQSKETLPGEWKAISVPLLYDEQLSQMRFFVRHDGRENNPQSGESGKPATRFLLNLNLSRMGGMQLDGFIHKKQFDLVLRTQDALPSSMRQDIMQKFAAGLKQVNLQGGMSFQAKRQGWVTVETAEHRGTVA